MRIREHLFLTGEFRERTDLLSGLTLEQVTPGKAGRTRGLARPA